MKDDTFIQQYKNIVEKAVFVSGKAKSEGLSALKELIESDANKRNVFEYGLRLAIDGEDKKIIEKILTNLVNLETNDEEKLLKNIEKDAVLAIQEGMETKTLELLLDSYVDIEAEESVSHLDPAVLFHFMDQDRYPPVIAHILAFLGAPKASVLLDNLPYKLQGDVAHRIATMDVDGAEKLRLMKQALKTAIQVLDNIQTSINREGQFTFGGVADMVEILSYVERSSVENILKSFEDADPELADVIKRELALEREK